MSHLCNAPFSILVLSSWLNRCIQKQHRCRCAYVDWRLLWVSRFHRLAPHLFCAALRCPPSQDVSLIVLDRFCSFNGEPLSCSTHMTGRSPLCLGNYSEWYLRKLRSHRTQVCWFYLPLHQLMAATYHQLFHKWFKSWSLTPWLHHQHFLGSTTFVLLPFLFKNSFIS